MNVLNLTGDCIIKLQVFPKIMHGWQARWAAKNRWQSLCCWDYLRVQLTYKINANLCEDVNSSQAPQNQRYKWRESLW